VVQKLGNISGWNHIGTVEHIGIHIGLAIKIIWLNIEWIKEN